MDSVNEETRRLTPAEADARVAALIAQYRNEEKTARRARSSSFPPSLGWIFVYLAGVVGGAIWHAKPLIAAFVGVPVLLIARALLARPGTRR
jgi:hypothetical protein